MATLYLDLISPYAYLTWVQVRRDALPVRVQPVLFAGLLQAHGHLGPAEIPPKARFLIRDCIRAADALGVPFRTPEQHPFNPLGALRLALPEVAGDDQARVLDALFAAGWQQGRDLADPTVLVDALDQAELDGEGLWATAQLHKADLRAATKAAIAAGVFGVPTFEVDGELIWGNDRYSWAKARILGEEAPISPERIQAAMPQRVGAHRKR